MPNASPTNFQFTMMSVTRICDANVWYERKTCEASSVCFVLDTVGFASGRVSTMPNTQSIGAHILPLAAVGDPAETRL